jgi:hypothetical protein
MEEERPPGSKLTPVGTTKDSCERNNIVRLAGKKGNARVSANSSKLIELPATTSELYWHCGGALEICATAHPFNWILCDRAENGDIFWTFYNKCSNEPV